MKTWLLDDMRFITNPHPSGYERYGTKRFGYEAALFRMVLPTQLILTSGDGSSFLFWEDNGWPSHPRNKGLTEPRYTTAMALHTAQPQAKIIVLLRDPANR